MPNACFSNPRHPNLDPKTNRKSNLEIDMKKIFFFGRRMPKKLSEWVPKITKKPTKSKPGPHRVLPCALQCPRIVPAAPQDRPRIVPGSPRTPKERLQACQMTPMGTKIHQKSIKIKAWTSKCCFVVCYAPQCPKIRPGFPSTPK